MTLQNLKEAVRTEARKWRTLVSVALLGALPYGIEIKNTISSNLPDLQPYLPENVYKFMGGAVVVAGMVLNVIATYRKVKASQ